MHGLFLLLLSAFLSILTVGAGPNVRGLAPVVLNVTHARHSPNNPQKFDNVTLWCSPDGPQVRITSAYFLRKKDGKRWVALVSPDKRNASYVINEPTVENAGEYRCELETTAGKASFATHLYLRPVVVSDEHFAQEESSGQSSAIVLKASAILVTVESDVNLTCPAVGHPPLKFKWTKDGKPLEMSPDIILEGNTIRFKKVNYTNEGKYDCATVNEIERANDYPRSGTKKVKTLLTIERELRVKSQYAWLYPLALIIVIFIALFIIIIFCEMRKKRLSRKDLYVAQE